MKVSVLRFNSFLIITFIIMNACTTTASRYIWKDDIYQGDPLKNVLIVGVDPNKRANIFLEEEFTQQLKARGINAIQSYTIFPEDTILEKKLIAAKSKELGIDAIIIINFYDVQETGTINYYGSSLEKVFDIYYLKCCYPVSSGLSGVIETKIFDKKYEKLIWAFLSEVIFSLGTFQYDVEPYFDTVINSLQDSKIIK